MASQDTGTLERPCLRCRSSSPRRAAARSLGITVLFMVNEQLAAIYTRQSKGSDKSIAEQEAENRKACDRDGWRVARVYRDTVSASKYTARARPDWERLLADLAAGRFGVLVMWESSRGDRKLSQWSLMLDTCEEQGVLIHVTSHGRTYDPRNTRDRRTLDEDGVDAQYESGKLSDRIRRGTAAAAVDGKPHGRVPFGYRRVHDDRTGKLVGQREDPESAPVVREIVHRLAAGEPVSAVMKDLNRRGVPAPSAGQWYRATVTKVGLNPAYIAKRAYQGKEFAADWPALVPAREHYAVARRFRDPARQASPRDLPRDLSRRITRPGRHVHLLSHIAVCGVCGAPLRAASGRTRPMYACSAAGHVYAPQDIMDAYVTELIKGMMSTRPWRDYLARQRSTDEEAVKAQGEADALEAELDEMAAMVGHGVTARQLAIAEARNRPLIDAARRRAAAVTVAGLPDIRAEWPGMDLHERRQAITRATERITLDKARRCGQRAFDTRRVGVKFPNSATVFRVPFNLGDRIDVTDELGAAATVPEG